MKDNSRTVSLEFLRHGPPHNQLLSPLTQYLALCGNHSAATVTMPFEHHQLLIRLNALLYEDREDTRKLQLKDTAQIMAGVLAGVPGLIAELADTSAPTAPLTHLRLILSASELALLPFELANAPNGFPGAGQPLGLQAQAPICITREVRRVSNTQFAWPRRPRILFIAAAPPEQVREIPLEAHLLALRKVIHPWLVDYDFPQTDLGGMLSDHLVVLPQATVASIQKACAEGNFTHIHILAHGVKLPGEEDRRYGIALHDETDPAKADLIDGARLATLLRTHAKRAPNRLSTPAVVTLASCVGAQQGSVVGAGASIAHALHEGGIPLVVGAQFPLSFQASVLMTQVLYEGLLWGMEPCVLLNDLRWQLRSRLPDTHDWASLVAYAALPTNLRDQLLEVRISQAHRSINAALKFLDKVTDTLKNRTKSQEIATEGIAPAREKKEGAARRLKDILEEGQAMSAEQMATIYGLLASTEKRDARISFIMEATTPDSDRKKLREEVTRRLKAAREHYADAFKADWTQTWALVQEISLTAVLSDTNVIERDAWIVARELSERDLDAKDRKRQAWALGNLIELYLLALLRRGELPAMDSDSKAMEYAQRLAGFGERSIEVYSLRRQIERYVDWFKDYLGNEAGAIVLLAEKIIKVLPHDSTSP